MVKSLVISMPTDLYPTTHNWPNGLEAYLTAVDSCVNFVKKLLIVSALACHATDPGSNPAQGDDFFN